MDRTISTLRKIVEKHKQCKVYSGDCGTSFGEVLCAHIHSPIDMPFKVLAKHFGVTLNELAKVISNHIRKL